MACPGVASMCTVGAGNSRADTDWAVTAVVCTRSKSTAIAARAPFRNLPADIRPSLHFAKTPSCIAFSQARRKDAVPPLMQRIDFSHGQVSRIMNRPHQFAGRLRNLGQIPGAQNRSIHQVPTYPQSKSSSGKIVGGI